MWYGAFSERNLLFAAKHGLNVTMSGPPPRLRQLANRYREIWSEAAPGKPMPGISSMYQLFVGETDAEAERIAEAAYERWYASMVHLWRANNAMPRETLPSSFAAASKLGSMIAGSPETVRQKLQAMLDASGLKRVLLQAYMGNMPQQAVHDSIARFGSEVKPRLTVAADA